MSRSFKMLFTTALAGAVLFSIHPVSSAFAQDDDDDAMDDGDSDAMDDGDGDAMDDGDGDAMDGGDGAMDHKMAMKGHHPMVLPKGKIAVAAWVNINLSTDLVGKPISINPDVKYGVMPKLDVGVYHSSAGITGFWASNGGGICLTGTDNNCAKTYNGPIGILANYSLGEGKLSLAANGGLVFRSLDPNLMAIKVGLRVRYVAAPKIVVMSAPSIFIGLNSRDPSNKELLNIPVMVGYMVSHVLHVGVQTGIAGPLSSFGDFFTVPLNLGAMYKLNSHMGIIGTFGFTNIAGKNSSADGRALSIAFNWHN